MKDMEVGNSEILENGGLKLSRKTKNGIIIGLCLGVGFGSLYGLHLDKMQDANAADSKPSFSFEVPGDVNIRDQVFIDENEVIVPYEQEDPINVSLEQINSLNIIINDSNCREDFINSVCEELDRDGIKFTFTRDNENINVDNSVVITLDQEYMAGPATVVFAPLENGRIGNSDALALAAQKAFYEKGFLIDGILCGQMGFRENEDGTISERIPTSTESTVGKDKNTSFVTISFGTQNTHAGLTASSIEAMLTRYYSYINAGYGNEDLIYCVEDGQDYEDIAAVLDTDAESLDYYNKTSDENLLLTGETIVNPVANQRREFNKHVPTNLYVDKTIWSK